MPQPCMVCHHPQRAAIDRALVAGTPNPELSALHRVSEDSLLRHKHRHLPLRLIKAQAAREEAEADRLLEGVRGLRGKALQLLLKAEQAGDLRTALLGIREARGCMELLAKLAGKLDERPTINVLVLPEFVAVQTAIVEALGPYPEAREAVVGRLAVLEGGRA